MEEKSSEVLRAVQAGESEIGVYDGNLPTTGLVSLPFRDDKLVMLVYTDHPLAARQHTDAPAEKALPPLAGALIKNEQDVQLLERLMFLHRRQGR